MNQKRCKKCQQLLGVEDFYPHPNGLFGRLHICKECHRDAVRANRFAKREYYQQYDRMRFQTDPSRRERNEAYAKTPRGRLAIKLANANWTKRNPHKRRAQIAVSNAIRDGRLAKSHTCSRCGEDRKPIQAHHPDYAKPLDVVWLCTACHSKEHFPRSPELGATIQ